MSRRMKETLRYLGYKKLAVDDQVINMIHDCFNELEQVVTFRYVYRIFEVEKLLEGIKIGNIKIESKHLTVHLEGCTRAIVFAASLGIECDRMIRKYEITNISKAVVFQACAATMLEEYCDETQLDLECKYQQNSNRHRARFSPGYGDF